jgi:hypothetical protein
MTYVNRWVRASKAALYEEKKSNRQIGIRKVQKKKGIFGSEVTEIDEPIYEEVIEKVPTGKYSDSIIDIEDFARRITDACNDLNETGYDVIKITEVIEGQGHYAYGPFDQSGGASNATCYSYGYGYSVTGGVVILGKKRESPQEA